MLGLICIKIAAGEDRARSFWLTVSVFQSTRQQGILMISDTNGLATKV